MTTRDIAVLVGSLRRASLNRKLASALAGLAPQSLRLEQIDIGGLALCNQDLDETPAPGWVAFRQRIKAADAILFVTPEYNRSIPAPLKNAIDVGSRPYGQSAWNGKPAAIVSASPSAIGGFGANHHLRQSAVTLNMAVLPTPELYIGHADKLFDDNGALSCSSTAALLVDFLRAFADWIERVH